MMSEPVDMTDGATSEAMDPVPRHRSLQSHLHENARGYLGAAIVFVLGVFVYWEASGYDQGTLLRMGPGYFPVVLSWLLMILGAGLAVETFFTRNTSSSDLEICSALSILAAIAVFGALLERFGMVPAVLFSVLVSSRADRSITLLQALVIAGALAFLSSVVFVGGLGLPVPLARW